MLRLILLQFVFICLLCSNLPLNAQNWLTTDGGTTNDEALDVASDTLGNYYVAGYFTSSAKFGNTTLVSIGSSDVFVSKYNSNGDIQWAISAGGSQPDKANSITVDKKGNVYVTGTYYDKATFGSTTLISAANSQDIFIAKYDTNGNLIWAKTFGGEDSEISYGIATDSDENIIITGQFKGLFPFGSTTLNSTINANNTPSFDIFTLKTDKNGNAIWAKQGKAIRDDRGLDLAVDAANNIFVVGQFSDTIRFDTIHNNTAANAGYLMKYDKNGNEIWFVRLNAQQTLVNGVAVDKNNEVFITGDYQGTLRIYTTPIQTNTSDFLYKIFIAKFNNSGNLIWVDNDGSDNEVTSKSITTDKDGNPYIVGLFKCKFDEYSQQYDNAVFYSAGYRDVFITKYSAAGQRSWFKQFGSSKDDYCGGVAIKNINKPVIAGSFESSFHVAYTPSFIIKPNNDLHGDSALTYCTSNNYNAILSEYSGGQKDVFITSPVDINQAPMDLFQRKGGICNQKFIKPCIENCKDTLFSCGPLNGLNVNSFEQFKITSNFESQYDFSWNVGGQGDVSYPIYSSGNYWVNLKRKDGCFENSDSIYVVINPLPDPRITDSRNINMNQYSPTTEIGLGVKDTITLWGTNETPGDSVYWTGIDHIKLNNSTIQITKPGQYIFNIISSAGCLSQITIEVGADTLNNGSGIPSSPGIGFLDTTFNKTDTIIICKGEGFHAALIDSSTFNISPYFKYKTIIWELEGGTRVYLGSTYLHHEKYIVPDTTGWYTLYTMLNNPNGSPPQPLTSRKFYAIVKPKPVINVSISCLTDVCPNDTVALKVTSNVKDFTWIGSNIYKDLHDSILVIAPPTGVLGYYEVLGYYLDTITGCGESFFSTCTLKTRDYPHITPYPTDGIICPNDSAFLSCEAGASYKWYGTSGNKADTNQTIYAKIPGKYLCIQTSADGCTQNSDVVEIKEYNTPNLDVSSYDICMGGSTTIYVISSDLAVIEWQAPLSGNDSIITITAPGKYTCHITQCGILTVATVVINQINVPSVISGNDSILCPGESIMLWGNLGASGYDWKGQNSIDSYLNVTQPGTYILETTDALGCKGISAPYVVTSRPNAIPPLAHDTTVCKGDWATINALALDSILWYDSPVGGTLIHKGYTFITPAINQASTFYLQTDDVECKSDLVPVQINLIPSSTIQPVFQKVVICVGSPLLLSASSVNDNYLWRSPVGTESYGQDITIGAVNLSDKGLYTQQYDLRCAGVVDSFFVDVVIPPVLTVAATDTICSGVPLHTALISDSVSTYFWVATDNFNTTGESLIPKTSSTLTDTIYNFTMLPQTVVYSVTPTSILGNCQGLPDTISIVVNHSNYPVSAIYKQESICLGNAVHLSAAANNLKYAWKGPNGFSDSVQSITINGVDLSNQGLYTQQYITKCSSLIDSFFVHVLLPPTLLPSIPDTICSGLPLNITLISDSASIFTWKANDNTNTTGENITATTTLLTFSDTIYNLTMLPQTVTYSVTPKSLIGNCTGETKTINVVVNHSNYPSNAIYRKDTICYGNSINLTASINNVNYSWKGPNGFNANTQSIVINSVDENNKGLFTQQYVTKCSSIIDSFYVSVHELPVLSMDNVNNICSGTTLDIPLFCEPESRFSWKANDNIYTNGESTSEQIGNNINDIVENPSTIRQTIIYSVTPTSIKGNCVGTTQQVNVTINPLLFPIAASAERDTILEGEYTVLHAITDTSLIVNWMPSESLNDSHVFDPIATPQINTTYTVSILDIAGCPVSATVSVVVLPMNCKLSDIFVPNTFTPNNDNTNDILYVRGNEISELYFAVYNRWGEIVFETTDISKGWDGKYKGVDVDPAVFDWYLRAKCYNSNNLEKKGNVTLLR